MPAPSTSGISDEITAADEIKVFHDEGEQGEETVCDRSSNQVDLHEVKLGLVEQERESHHQRLSRDQHERSRNAERVRLAQADNYRHQAFVAAAQAQAAFYGFPGSSSQFGYHHMVPPYGPFPPVHSPMAGMQIPKPIPIQPTTFPGPPYGPLNGMMRNPYQLHEANYCTNASKMIPSPLGGSPIPTSPFLGAGTPPPAHMGGLSSRGCSPFHPLLSPHAGMFSPDLNWSSIWNQGPYRHSTSPFAPPTMAGSPFNPFMGRMGSPMMPHAFHPHFGVPQSPDHSGRYSVHGHGEVSSSRVSHGDSSESSTSSNRDPSENRYGRSKKEKNHVKKPLNAFMLYMKEMRAKVQAECTLKESAAINQILGKKWHALAREEQSKYYEMAKLERENHAREYPGWTAKDNYALCGKKKRRKKEKSDEPKKCRAIYGIERQAEWCKPCRRKKKCVRYMQNGALMATNGSEYMHDRMEPKSSSESVSCVSSSMQALSPSGESVASSSMSPASAAASTG